VETAPTLAVLALIVLLVPIAAAVFLLFAAKIAGIPKSSFGRALAAVVLGSVAGFIFSLVLSSVPVAGAALGFIGGFVAQALVMMPIFKTTFGRALGATVLAWALALVVAGLLIFVLGMLFGGIAALSA